MVVIFMLPKTEEMYLFFAQDGCHFWAAKSWRHVFIISSGWFSFLCYQELYLLRMVVIFKLLRVFLDKYLRLNSSPWWISLVYKRILFALHKSIMWIGQILIRKASFLQGLYLPCLCHDCHRVVSFFMYSNQIQCSLWAG